jgi:hypothetical protein
MDFLPEPTKDNGQPLKRPTASTNYFERLGERIVNSVSNLIARSRKEDTDAILSKLDAIEQKRNIDQTVINLIVEEYIEINKEQVRLEERKRRIEIILRSKELYSIEAVKPLQLKNGDDERDTSPVVAIPPNKD